jgi:hypothetical protein
MYGSGVSNLGCVILYLSVSPMKINIEIRNSKSKQGMALQKPSRFLEEKTRSQHRPKSSSCRGAYSLEIHAADHEASASADSGTYV